MRIVACIILTLLIQGCGVSMPKYMAYDNFKNHINLIESTAKNLPYMFYCYNKDQEQLKTEFGESYNQCIETVFMKIPAETTIGAQSEIAQEIAFCTYGLHAMKNRQFFSTDSLTPEQVEKCTNYKKNIIDVVTEDNGTVTAPGKLSI